MHIPRPSKELVSQFFSSIGDTPTFFLMHSLTQSNLVYFNTPNSVTLTVCLCSYLVLNTLPHRDYICGSITKAVSRLLLKIGPQDWKPQKER